LATSRLENLLSRMAFAPAVFVRQRPWIMRSPG
jgi:hypothetical protein